MKQSRALVPWRRNPVKHQTPTFRTICSVLRELHETADAPARQKIEEAYDMAKRMQRKLLNYNKQEVYSSVPTEGDGLVRLYPDELRDIVTALNFAQSQTSVDVGGLKGRWDKLITYLRKHLAEENA